MAHILVVNDEQDLVELCALVLEEAGHEVDTLIEGLRAPSLALETGPDLIVLDWLMKDTTGDEVVRQLRAEPATAPIPILMISAIPEGEMTARMFGLEGYLGKPFTADDLRHSVERVLGTTERAAAR